MSSICTRCERRASGFILPAPRGIHTYIYYVCDWVLHASGGAAWSVNHDPNEQVVSRFPCEVTVERTCRRRHPLRASPETNQIRVLTRYGRRSHPIAARPKGVMACLPTTPGSRPRPDPSGHRLSPHARTACPPTTRDQGHETRPGLCGPHTPHGPAPISLSVGVCSAKGDREA